MRKLLYILAVILTFSACGNGYTEAEKNFRVERAGNIHNDGYITEYNGKYYFANKDDYDNLYVMDKNEENKKKLSGNHYFYNLNICGDYIYYVSGSPGKIYRVTTDGKNKEKLSNDNSYNLIRYDKYLFYRLSEDDDWGKLCRIDLDGGNKKILCNSTYDFCIYDNVIYFGNMEDNTVCSINIDGTGKKTLVNSLGTNIDINAGKLYYSDDSRGGHIFSYDLKSETEAEICSDKCWNLNLHKDWIIYRNQSDGGDLYCISYDGSVKKRLVGGNIVNIIVLDDDIFYRNVDDETYSKIKVPQK